MANLATIHDLMLDGTSIQQSPIGIWLEIVAGINEIPAFRGEDDTVPSRPGRVAYPFVPDVTKIELDGWVLGIGSTDAAQLASFRGLIAVLKGVLLTAAANPVSLSGILEDGSTATINVRVVDTSIPEIVAGHAAAPKIALQSVDPFWVIV